jgi:hypothetical protein
MIRSCVTIIAAAVKEHVWVIIRENHMNIKFAISAALLACLGGSALADALPGTPRREYRGRIYYYQPIRYYSPVWYAGNGVIATRRQAGAPLWPYAQYNKVY